MTSKVTGERMKSGHKRSIQDTSEATESPVTSLFRQFQVALDARHDKQERLVKISRDITITSKRIIFLIHRINSDEDQLNVLSEVDTKLTELECTKWRQLAVELKEEDPFQYLRAYSPGLQEYIEAVSLYYFIKDKTLPTLSAIQQRLTFSEVDTEAINITHPLTVEQDASSLSGAQSCHLKLCMAVHIPPIDYILGVADVTGELMRIAVHSAGVGDLHTPYAICCMLRDICSGMGSLDGMGRECQQKLSVLRQSLAKVENTCYALHVRRSELPCHMIATVPNFPDLKMSSCDTERGYEYD